MNFGATDPVTVEAEPVLALIDAAAAGNYEVRRAVNGVFDDGDDVLHTILPDYQPDSTQVVLNVLPSPLPEGLYRLTIKGNATIHDLAGLRLDGDGDGTAGGNYVRTWGNHPEHIQAFEPRSLKALLSPHFASVDVETCFPWLIAIGSRNTAVGRGT